MSEKFQNKYRIASARLKTFDYGGNGAYFVTMCTQNREYFFGDIVDGQMQLSETGKIAHKFWIEIPNHFSFVKLGEFVVMPNHVHGIVIIDKREETPNLGVSTSFPKPTSFPQTTNAKTTNTGGKNDQWKPETLSVSASFPKTTNAKTTNTGGKNDQWKPGTLGVIINQYKRICTIHARKTDPEFGWQTRFYDVIIWNDRAFHAISNYIINNPQKW